MAKAPAKPAKSTAVKHRDLPDLSGSILRPARGGVRNVKASTIRKAVDAMFLRRVPSTQA